MNARKESPARHRFSPTLALETLPEDFRDTSHRIGSSLNQLQEVRCCAPENAGSELYGACN